MKVISHQLSGLSTALKINALAQATGASVRSIRHYDQQGLLASARAENGYRAFQAVAISQIKQIQRLIATRFSLEEIRGFPDCMLLIEGAKACANIYGRPVVRLDRHSQIEHHKLHEI